MTTLLSRIAKKARNDRKMQFTAVAHVLTPEFLAETWSLLNRKGAAGVNGETIEEYDRNLNARLENLHEQLKQKAYQTPPVRRVRIPKGDGKFRNLGIPTVEDRLLQAAVARILNALYEPLFLDCSCGFRPNRDPHDALRKLRNVIMTKTTYVYEADIRAFFDKVNHEWLRKMLRLRIKDPVILRLIDKWLKAGVMDEGLFQLSDEGVPQGGPISPILSNIYLHYALDLWFEKVVKPRCEGPACLIRYADDWIVCFLYTYDMQWFEWNIKARLRKFNIELAPEKTRKLVFGRHWRKYLGDKKPSEFSFLGFRHICGTARNGNFALIRLPDNRRIARFRNRAKDWMWKHRHWKVRHQQKHLSRMLKGFFGYYALRGCTPKLKALVKQIQRLWRYSLGRRGQRKRLYWDVLLNKSWFQLPTPIVVHRDC